VHCAVAAVYPSQFVDADWGWHRPNQVVNSPRKTTSTWVCFVPSSRIWRGCTSTSPVDLPARLGSANPCRLQRNCWGRPLSVVQMRQRDDPSFPRSCEIHARRQLSLALTPGFAVTSPGSRTCRQCAKEIRQCIFKARRPAIFYPWVFVCLMTPQGASTM
jgi:hypothetical protein